MSLVAAIAVLPFILFNNAAEAHPPECTYDNCIYGGKGLTQDANFYVVYLIIAVIALTMFLAVGRITKPPKMGYC